MNRVRYELRAGETPRIIARRFTGNPERWRELIASNPQAQKSYMPGFGMNFVPGWWTAGRAIYLPGSWRVGVSGPQGQVGADGELCSVTPVTAHPTAYYLVQSGEMPAAVAANKFGRTAPGGWGDWSTLMGANYDDPYGFHKQGEACVMKSWKPGLLIRVPKDWIDVEMQYFPTKAKPFLKNQDGTPWTGIGSTPTQGCPDGQYPNPNKNGACDTALQCAADQNFNPLTWQCEKKTGQGVGYEEDKSGGGMPTWGWILLAAGAGIGGALLLANLTKAKKVPVAPGAKPAAKGEEEVVVRR